MVSSHSEQFVELLQTRLLHFTNVTRKWFWRWRFRQSATHLTDCMVATSNQENDNVY